MVSVSFHLQWFIKVGYKHENTPSIYLVLGRTTSLQVGIWIEIDGLKAVLILLKFVMLLLETRSSFKLLEMIVTGSLLSYSDFGITMYMYSI